MAAAVGGGAPRPARAPRIAAAAALASAIAGFVGPLAPLVGQAGPLRGTVVDAGTGEPIADARVHVRSTPLVATTGEEGGFEISGLGEGSITLFVVAEGYRTVERALEIGPAGASDLRVELERPWFAIPDLVVTASREAARPGDAPVSVAVMSEDELRRRNVVSLDEALPFAQGVIFNSGQMDIRGSTGLARGVGSRVLMLLDGHRFLSGVGASIDFDALPVLDVERIEIVKGPHSTLWGTNALAGVVNVITERPPADPETTARAYYGFFDTPGDLDFTDESLSMRGLALQHRRRIGDVGATLYAAREESDGFRQNGSLERWRLRGKTVFPVGSSNPWELFVNWVREDEEEFFTWLSAERPLEVDPVELGDWKRTEDLAVGLTATPVVTSSARLRVRPTVYHARSENHFHDNEDFHRSTRYGTDVQLSLFPGRRHSITAGAEGAWTDVTSNFLSPDPGVVDLALYAQDEIALTDRLRGSIGLRFDLHEATSAERDVALNPKLGLVLQPSERLSLRTSLGRGYRAPSISEQFTATTVFGFRVIPNLELRGESAWAAEVGGTASFGDRLWLDGALFWTEYTDLIEPTPAPNEFFTFQFRNVAEATVRGLDAGVRLGLLPRDLTLRASYVFLDTEDARTGRALPYRSRHNVTTTLATWSDRLALDFRFRSRVAEVLAFPLDERGSITLVDLRFAGRVLGTDVQAKIENLFQAEYVDVQERTPGQTRSFRLTVTPRF
ncbi:MAG: TonB-dependent receptor [Gemmatimonadota bacterium]|nr:TonB-dependent receptor [Gemmatimonadota bacterium]